MTAAKKLTRGSFAEFVAADGFSVRVKLTGYNAAAHWPLMTSIADVQRCAQMGDWQIEGYDFKPCAFLAA